jgi:hypothetical protein
MVLCDYAQAADGKLNVIGGGWTLIGPQPAPSAIGMIFEIPWDRTNEQLGFRLELVDQDGAPFTVDTPDGEQPLLIEGHFEVGRPPGIKPGTPLTFPFAVNLPPHEFAPGGRYEWRLTVNGQSDQDWRLAFGVRSQ